MILRFLSLFRLFREAVEARIRAEDEARSQRSRAERAEERAMELAKDLLHAKDRMIDVLARKALGVNVFAEADPGAIPFKQSFAPGRREQAHDARAIQEHKFVNDIKALFNSDSDNSAA